jgi:hypothetical protein
MKYSVVQDAFPVMLLNRGFLGYTQNPISLPSFLAYPQSSTKNWLRCHSEVVSSDQFGPTSYAVPYTYNPSPLRQFRQQVTRRFVNSLWHLTNACYFSMRALIIRYDQCHARYKEESWIGVRLHTFHNQKWS